MAGNAEDMITLTSAERDLGGSDPSGAAAPDAEALVVTDNSELGTYEATIGGRTAAGLVYNKVGSRVTLLATSVLPEFRGKGVASRLIGGVLDDLRMQGKTVTVTCPFTAAFFDAHPEYADLVDPELPGTRTLGVGIEHVSSRLNARRPRNVVATVELARRDSWAGRWEHSDEGRTL